MDIAFTHSRHERNPLDSKRDWSAEEAQRDAGSGPATWWQRHYLEQQLGERLPEDVPYSVASRAVELARRHRRAHKLFGHSIRSDRALRRVLGMGPKLKPPRPEPRPPISPKKETPPRELVDGVKGAPEGKCRSCSQNTHRTAALKCQHTVFSTVFSVKTRPTARRLYSPARAPPAPRCGIYKRNVIGVQS